MPPDLEPASALLMRLQTATLGEGRALIESGRAAVREPLERRVRELENQLDEWSDRFDHLGVQHDETRGYRAQAEDDLADARQRIASLEAQLASARESNRKGAEAYAALLEKASADLESAREEALREAIAACQSRERSFNAEHKRLEKEWLASRCGSQAGEWLSKESEQAANSAHGCAECVNEIEALLTSPPKSPWIPAEELEGYAIPTACAPDCQAYPCQARRELARRLRELVPLLEEMRQNCADWDEDGGFREELDRAIALAKGGEER